MGLVEQLLIEFNITDQADAVERILNIIGKEAIKVDHYVASGHWGDVFKVKGTDKIIKLTHSSIEFMTARKIKMERESNGGKDFEHIINIYFTKQANWYKDSPFVIIGEYLEEDKTVKKINGTNAGSTIIEAIDRLFRNNKVPKSDIEYLINEITKSYVEEDKDDVRNKLTTIVKNIDDEQVTKSLFYIMAMFPIEIKDIDLIVEGVDIINDVTKGFKTLADMDVDHSDFHFENILKDPKTGNYKLIDIQ